MPNREALFALVTDRLLLERFLLPEVEGRGWQDWMRETARRARAVMRDAPGIADLLIEAHLDRPALHQKVNHALGLLIEEYGLPPTFALHTMSTLMTLTAAFSAGPRRVPFGQGSALVRLVAPTREHGSLPHLIGALERADLGGDEQFAYMIDVVVLGAERRLADWNEPDEPTRPTSLRELVERAAQLR